MSYLKRHWRGELPLTQSYWVNFVICSWPVLLLGKLVDDRDVNNILVSWIVDHPRLGSAALIAFFAAYCSLVVWQVVGVFRSARRHIATTGHWFWARVAQSLAIITCPLVFMEAISIGPFAWQLTQFSLQGDPWPIVNVRIVSKGREILVEGPFGFGSAQHFEAMLAAAPQARVVRLDSIGGRIGDATKIAELVKLRRLDTYVPRQCLSGCTNVFVAGENRILGYGANLGFHQTGLPGVSSDLMQPGTDVSIDWFRRVGVTEDFIDRAFHVPNQGMWVPTPDELLGAKVATRLSDGSEFAIITDDKEAMIRDLESTLLQAPGIAAVLEVNPGLRAEALANLRRAVEEEGTMQEAFASVRKRIDEAFEANVMLASDESLLHLARIILLSLTELRSRSAEACIAYLFPGSFDIVAESWLSNATRKESLQAKSEVIATALRSPAHRLNPHETDQVLSSLFVRVSKRVGWDVRAVGSADAARKDPKKACDAFMILYEEMLTGTIGRQTREIRAFFS